MNEIQIDDDGRLRHLLALDGVPREMLLRLLDRADALIDGDGGIRRPPQTLAGASLANLFYEPSTRTRISFELAAKRLGAHVVNLDAERSSETKGETLVDTLTALGAMGVDFFVVRHREVGVPEQLAGACEGNQAVINAGEGHMSHPTQGLLDTLTIRRHRPDLEKLKVAIVGDIRHSRVAGSLTRILHALDVDEIRLVGPSDLLPDMTDRIPGQEYSDMEAGIRDADVVVMLRIQRERMDPARFPDPDHYREAFGLTPERLSLMRPDALVMHPGPMNRGLEIASEVAEGPQSVILEQVRNGVAVRMAVMETLYETIQHG